MEHNRVFRITEDDIDALRDQTRDQSLIDAYAKWVNRNDELDSLVRTIADAFAGLTLAHDMRTSELLAWVATGSFSLLGGWAIVDNYALAIRWYVRRRHGSLIPFVGGVLFCGAMLICPVPGVGHWAWIPLIADLGCVPLLGGCLYHIVLKK